MSTFRNVNKNVNYTVMSNHHLQDKRLSESQGLLSYMLSLPDDWDYSLKGLTTGCRDGIDSVRSAVHELRKMAGICVGAST